MTKDRKKTMIMSLIAVVVFLTVTIVVVKLLDKGPFVYAQEKIAINYSKNLKQVDLNAQNIEVLDGKGKKINISFNFLENSQNIVIINPPTQGYEAGKKYTLHINSDISFNIEDKYKDIKVWVFKGKKDNKVEFPDKNLAFAVKRQIGKAKGDIYLGEIYKLNTLNAENLKIVDLKGIEKLASLKILGLSDNKIKDIDRLKNLKELDTLALANNKIKDISPLKGLTKLKTLWLMGNDIKDYKPVAEYFKNLTAKDFKLN